MPIDRRHYSREDISNQMNAESDDLLFQDGDKDSMAWDDYVKAVQQENEVIEAFDKLAEQEKREQKAKQVVKDSISTDYWWSGIYNFVEGFNDRLELDDIYHDKETDKWYKADGFMNNTLSVPTGGWLKNLDKSHEISFDEVQQILEQDSQKLAQSTGYAIGKSLYDIGDKVINEGIRGGIISLGSILARGIGGLTDMAGITDGKYWDDASTAQMWGMWNATKNLGNDLLHSTVDLYNDTQNILGIDSDEEAKRDKFENDKRYAEWQKSLNKENKEITALGEKGLEERKKVEDERRKNGNSFVDKLYDMSGIEDWRDHQDTFNRMAGLIQQRASVIEGVQKETFSGVDDEISDKKYKYKDPSTGQEIEFAMEKAGGDDGQSKSIWDVKKLLIDPNTGQPVIGEDGQPMYVDKYSVADKIAKSNFGAVTNKYWLSEDFAQGVGSAVGFVIGGKGVNAVIGKLGKVAGTASKAIGSATKFESKLLNYTNKMMTNLGRETLSEAKFAGKLGKLNTKMNMAVRTTAQSYIMTNAESHQIGIQAQREIINKGIDDATGFTTKDAIKNLQQNEEQFVSEQAMMLKAEAMVETERNKWKKENPEQFNDIVNRSIVGRDAAINVNNINFINNLTSAGLFVKGKSLSHMIRKNPFIRKSIRKGAWTLTHEGFQEGFIEEGITNGFAEKHGKAAGELKFYTFSDYAKNNIGTGEFAENVFAGALLGMMQTGATNATNLKGDYKSFKNQQKEIKRLQEIGVVKNKEELGKLINYSLDKNTNEQIKIRMDALENEGKREEASQLADLLLMNKAVNAAKTGTTGVLTEQMQKLMESEFLDEQDKKELQKAINFNEMVGDVYDNHTTYHNQGGIATNRANKFMLDEDLKTIEEDFGKIEDEYNSTIERLAKKELKKEGVKETDDNYITELDKKKTRLQKDEKLRESNSTVKEYHESKKTVDKYKETIDQLNEEYDYITSPKGQKEFIQKKKREEINRALSYVTEENKKQVKRNLKKNGLLTKDVENQIDQAAKQRQLEKDMPKNEKANPVEKAVEPKANPVEKAKSETKPITDSSPEIKKSASKFKNVETEVTDNDPANQEVEQYNSDEIKEKASLNDLLNLSPAELDNSDRQKNKINTYTGVINSIDNNLKNKNSELDEKIAFALLVSEAGADVAERNFNLFKKAYQQSNAKQNENFNWDKLYNEYFGGIEGFRENPKNITTPTNKQIIETNDKIDKELHIKQSEPIGQTQDKDDVRYTGDKIAEPNAKMSFLGIEFDEVISEDGKTVKKVNKDSVLNPNTNSDLNLILDQDGLQPGTEFEVKIPADHKSRKVTVYSKNNQGLMIRKVMSFGEYMTQNDVQEGSDEWIAKVPMDLHFDNGRVVKNGMHDASNNGWWRRENVADFKGIEGVSDYTAKQMQEELVKKGRETTFELRKQIHSGDTKMYIKKKRSGHTTKIDEKGTMQTVNNADSNAEFVVLTDIGLTSEKKNNKVKVAFDGKIEGNYNLEYNENKGHVFMVVRSTTEKNDLGEVESSYRTIKLHTNHNQKALTELRKSLRLLYNAYDILTNSGDYGRGRTATEVQKQFAERVRQGIKEITGGYDIKLGIGENHYNLKELYPKETKDKNGKKTGGLHLEVQLNNMKDMPFPIINIDGTVTNYEGGYIGMLKNHLYTEKQFFTIKDKQGNEKRTAFAQPIITFDAVSNKKSNSKPSKETIKENKVKEKIEKENREHQNFVNKLEQQAQKQIENDGEDLLPGQKEKIEERLEQEKKIAEINHKHKTEEIKKNVENKEEQSSEPEKITNITEGQKRRVVEYLFHQVLRSYDVSKKEVSIKDILNDVKNSFDNHLKGIVDHQVAEYEYLQEHKDEILGIGKYENALNSVAQQIGAFLNEELTEDNDTETDDGVVVKRDGQASYERDVKVSLSSRLKMFFAGIEKDNSINDEFAGLPSYYTMDEVFSGLQDMLSDVSNSETAFKTKIELQVEKNLEEFGYLREVAKRYDEAPLEVKKEILYRLNQTKVEMYFILYSQDTSGKYTLQTYDANSANPNIKLKQHFQQTLKQSDLVNHNGDFYTINKPVAEKLIRQYQSWINNIDNISNEEISNWLSHFGIIISNKTIQDYRQGLVVDGNFETAFSPDLTPKYNNGASLFHQLVVNLNKQLNLQNTNPETKFEYSAKNENLLLDNNNNYLKNLIKTEVNNTNQLATTMYIAGKSINAFAQPNFTTEQLRKLKSKESELVKDLQVSPFSKDSFLLNVILNNDSMTSNLGIGYVSLEAIKQKSTNSSSDNSITDLSSQDYKVLLAGFLQNEGKSYQDSELLKNYGITTMREMKMTFPTLSDSSQMLLFNTVGIGLKRGNFEFDDSGNADLSDGIVDFLYTQLVSPDINRMETYLKSNKNINIQGLDLGSQIFTIIPSLNSLEVDYKGTPQTLLSLVHESVKKGNNVEEVLSEYKDDIKKKVKEVVKESATKKLTVDGDKMAGTWVDKGIISDKGVIMDAKYLENTKSTDRKEQVQIATYDFTVNYLLNQAQIQMLFAGDIANYVPGKLVKMFTNGDVRKPKINEADGLKTAQDVYTKVIQVASVNMSKRLKELISPGNRLAESANEKYMQIMVNDVENSSTTIEDIVKLFYPDKFDANKGKLRQLKKLEKDVLNKQEKGEPYEATQKEVESLVKELKNEFPDIAPYFEITSTDAQEYTTWGEHLHVLLNQGRVTEEQYKTITKKLKAQSEELNAGKEISDKNKLSNEDKKVVFQPLKPLHAGLYFEDMFDDKDKSLGKLQRFVYVKTSSFPLLPEMTQGTKLDNLRKNVEKIEFDSNKKVRVSYQSGNKVGAVKNAINMSEMYGELTPDLHQKITDSAVTLKRENFSIQQDKPFKSDKNMKKGLRDEINTGTQFEKIILGNGINNITRKIFPNLFENELLNELGIESKNGKISGQELYKIYRHLYNQEQEIKKNELFESLGLDEQGNWQNDVETLEKIQKMLNKRLSNQQDKDLLELSYIVREKDGDKWVNRYYTKEEIKKRKLIPTGAEFNIPLWMSPNSQKFESVLNSIVNNKLIYIKHPGFSSPVASQQGFEIKEENDIDNKGIIYTEKYNKEKGLTATYITNENGKKVLSHAQILVASKFKTKVKKNGKWVDDYIDLTKYTKKLDDGRVVLDTNRVSPELLEMFSFRIPTSAHQSGAVVEIVGFLPKNQGDLMIVPKDHTVQLGEDYDIDTRYAYTQNYYIDPQTDNIKKINEEYINDQIEYINRHSTTIDKDILNMFDNVANNEELQAMMEEDIPSERKKKLLINNLKHQLIENQLIDMYKSVFSSTEPEIQQMIGSVLSTQKAEDTAELIDNELNSSKNNSNFTIFDDEHQESILKLGASGKLGIGVHSNWVVFNSLLQQIPENKKPKLISAIDKNGNAIPFEMTIGDFTSNGQLGRIESLKANTKNKAKQRQLSTINMENQNCATDNQKLQVMGKRNENKYTINAFALMCNLGFDMDIVNGKEAHLPSLFISQPIIKRFVELKEKNDSVTSKDYMSDKDIIEKLIEEFDPNKSVDRDKAIQSGNRLTAQNLFENLKNPDVQTQIITLLNFDKLNKQSQTLMKVQSMSNIGKGLGVSFFDVLNKKDILVNNMTMGNTLVENVEEFFGEQKRFLSTEQDDIQDAIDNGFIKIEENENGEVILMRPTSPLNAKIINSISTAYNLWKNLLPFESEHIKEQIDTILSISGVKDTTTKKATEMKYKIISDMKDFIYSLNNIGIFDDTTNNERNRLFMDTKDNQSLASFLNKLKKEKHSLFNEAFFRDIDFSLNKNDKPSIIKYATNDKSSFNKNSVYTIFRVLNESDKVLGEFNGDKNYTNKKLVKDLVKYSLLANQEKGAIGFRTHIPVDVLQEYGVTDMLRTHTGVEKTNSHNLLVNGDFRGLMKLMGSSSIQNNEIVNRLGVGINIIQDRVNKTNARFGKQILTVDKNTGNVKFSQLSNTAFKSLFVKQFFQHNPGYVKKLRVTDILDVNTGDFENFDGFRLGKTTKNEKGESIKKLQDGPQFLRIESPNGKDFLFQRTNYGTYQQVNTLGTHGVNEYNPFYGQNKSIVKENNFEKTNSQPTVKPISNESKPVVSSEQTKDDLGIGQDMSVVLDNIEKSNGKYSKIASLLKMFVKDNTNIEVLDTKIGNGFYVPKNGREYGDTYESNGVTLTVGNIYISKDLLNSGNKELIEKVIIEEILHSVTVDEVNKYVDTNASTFNEKGELNIKYLIDNPPAHIVKLVSLFKEGSKHILKKYADGTTMDEAIKRYNENKQYWIDKSKGKKVQDKNLSLEEKTDTYRTLNLGEFIAGVFLSEDFRNELDKASYKSSGKSIFEHIKESIAKLLKGIAPGINENKISANVIGEVFNILEKETGYNQKNIYKKPSVSKTKTDNITETLLNKEVSQAEKELDKQIQEEQKSALVNDKSFTYKGVTIDTKFPLGEQQKKALIKAIDFVENPGNNDFFTIEGSAGTGKTTIIGYLQKYFKKKGGINEFRYLAPTHAATAQLALTTTELGNRQIPFTIASSFYSFTSQETGEPVRGFQKKLGVDGFANYTLIIDEASMIEDSILEELIETAKENNILIIFMGDSNQIPSPDSKSTNSKGQKVLNRAFGDEHSVKLTKVYRQNKSDLLYTLDAVKENTVMTNKVVNKDNDGTIRVMDKATYNKEIIEDFTNDPENTVFIAYTNKAVQEFNNAIKQIITGTDKLKVGDKIMGYAGKDTKQILKGNLANSISYEVKSFDIIEDSSMIYIEGESKILKKLKDKNIQNIPKTSSSTYVQLSFSDSIVVDGITQEEMNKTNKKISAEIDIYYEAYIKEKNYLRKKEIQEKVIKLFGSYDFGNNYYYNPKTKMLQTIPAISGRIGSIFSTMKGLDYGYAITAHKSQGMTVDNVYVDFDNIYNSRANQQVVNKKGEVLNTEKNALYYVALSRARKKVVMKSSNIKVADKPVIETQNSENNTNFADDGDVRTQSLNNVVDPLKGCN